MTESPALSLTRDGPIAILTIDRPGKRNALNREILEAWPDRLREAAEDPTVRVLIVTGGVGASFSSGADIEEFQALVGDREAVVAFSERFAAAQDSMAAFPKPAIAMISGGCVGGGCGLALGCDLRLADNAARFGITPATLGLDYSIADTKRLVDAVGFAHAADILFSGRLLTAGEALAMGLVNRVLEPAQLEHETLAVARRIAARAPSSLRAIKSHLQEIKAGRSQDDAASRQAFYDAFAGPDFAEGLAAFREKRPARFD